MFYNEAAPHVPGALVHLLLAVAALAEKLVQAFQREPAARNAH